MPIDYDDVTKLRKELKRLKPDAPEWTRKFAKINKAASQLIVEEARSRARASGKRQQARAASAIKASSNAKGIKLLVSGGASRPYALAAFWGAKRRTGWYAKRRYKASTGRQFSPWVTNAWEVGGTGGPYAINPAIAARVDEVMEAYGDAVGELMDDLNLR